MKRSFQVVFALMLISVVAIPLAADIKAKSRMNMGAQAQGMTIEQTTFIKGARQRMEMNTPMMKMITIHQCDTNKVIQINESCKKYFVQSAEPGEGGAVPAGGQGRRGGVVTFTSTSTDTGERQQMFGKQARHLKTNMTSKSSPDACHKQDMKMEMDGWYIDVAPQLNCATGERAALNRPQQGECQDTYRIQASGGGVRPGYPVKMSYTVYENNRPMTFSMETTELSEATLDAGLFEVPAGFTEAKSMQELMMCGMPSMGNMGEMMRQAQQRARQQQTGEQEEETSAVPTQPTRRGAAAGRSRGSGILRIGLIEFKNSGNAKTFDAERLRQQMVDEFKNMGAEAIIMDATVTEDIAEEVEKKHIQYVVFTDFTTVKDASMKKKIGGMFGRVTGRDTGGTADAQSEASTRYQLFKAKELEKALKEDNATGKGADMNETMNNTLRDEASKVMEEIKKDLEKD